MQVYKKQLRYNFVFIQLVKMKSLTGKNIYKDYFSYTAGISLNGKKSFGKQFSFSW